MQRWIVSRINNNVNQRFNPEMIDKYTRRTEDQIVRNTKHDEAPAAEGGAATLPDEHCSGQGGKPIAASDERGFADAGAAHSKKPTQINKGRRMQWGGADCMVLGGGV